MTAKLSTRISLRWLPDPPFESTDTLVMSVDGYYMDLRVKKADCSIDWAMAGQRLILSREPRASALSRVCHPYFPPSKLSVEVKSFQRRESMLTSSVKCQWTHLIDSRGYSDPDVGSFTSLPNGDDLETGSMPCPEKGNAMTEYEEVWRDLPIPSSEGFSWIMQSVDRKGTTFVGRVAGYFLAFEQSYDGSFSAKRQDLDAQSNVWNVTYSIGNGRMPLIEECTEASTQFGSQWTIGDIVPIAGDQYRVVALKAANP